MNLHGIPRTVGYLDLCVDFKPANIKKVFSAFEHLEFVPKPPLDYDELLKAKKRSSLVDDKGLTVFTFISSSNPSKRIDILLDPPVDFREIHAGKKEVPFGELTIPVLSLDDLIVWKSGSSRKQDASDVEALKAVRKVRN